jgi:16S rRNA (cytosine967-C5)-methyltransferase
MKKNNIRAVAAKVIHQVMDKGVSLSDALPEQQQNVLEKDQALLQEICFGVIRNYAFLDGITRKLLDKKIPSKQRVFHHLINVGLYQLEFMRTPSHAAVSETVQACLSLKGMKFKGLINACLRNFQRNREQLLAKLTSDSEKFNHPAWFINNLKTHYTSTYEDILTQNQLRAPMWIRVQESNISVDKFIAELTSANIEFSQPLHKQAILLSKPVAVESIPGFESGWFTVQDGAAQHAACLLEPKDGETILDACSAPGGKACHVLDQADVELYAVDVDSKRLERVHNNLTRLNLTANVMQVDLANPDEVSKLPEFDRILLDAPCSATGVIRRHPDIKWLRRESDIARLSELQSKILEQLWPKLKKGGTLLYATCSILPQENSLQMKQFLSRHQDAKWIPISSDENIEQPGWQITPGQNGMDGFYYCKIVKQ